MKGRARVHPTNLKLVSPDLLFIEWSDGERRHYPVVELRDRCPCATCREKRRQDVDAPPTVLPVISSEEAQPLTISAMEPMGNYAYSIQFSDGHDTGIFALDLLKELGSTAEESRDSD